MSRAGAGGARDRVVAAAGTVLWRRGDDGETRFAVIHRPEYDDWSLPKGKLEPGEGAPAAAARETREETGWTARLGRYLQSVSYPLGSRRIKHVDYWSAEALSGGFRSGREVDDLRWIGFADAVELLTHDVDRAVLARHCARRPGEKTLIVIRHARAGKRGRFDGPDERRPLDRRGRVQARLLVPQTLAFGPTAVHAADRTRCVETVAPLADSLGVQVRREPVLTEEAYAADPDTAYDRMRALADSPGIAVVCSQGGVIPELIDRWAGDDGTDPGTTRTRKAASWILTLRGGRLIAADALPPPVLRIR